MIETYLNDKLKRMTGRAVILIMWGLWSLIASVSSVSAHSANEVWFEFRPDGRYRVYINYTVPELKEYREAYVDFVEKSKAEAFYWRVVRGGDFHLSSPDKIHFHDVKKTPQPW